MQFPSSKAVIVEIGLWFFLIILLAATMIWIRTATVKMTYQYVQQEKELYQLRQETQAARVKWLQLTTPKRLDMLAKKLGLIPTPPDQITVFEKDKTVLKP